MEVTPRRILYVQRPLGGGSAVSLFEATRRLDRERFSPVVVLPAESPWVERFGAIGVPTRHVDADGPRRERPRVPGPVRRILRSLGDDAEIAVRLADLIRRERIDLVHHNNNLAANRASIAAAILTGRPQICHVRFFARYRTRVDRRLSQWVDRFVYISRAVERHCREALDLAADRGIVLDNVFDLSGPVDADRRAVRASLGIPADAPVVTSVGRLVAWKGQDVVLRAAAEASLRHPELRCVIVGGPNPDDASRAFAFGLQRLAEAVGIGDRVVFAGHRDDADELMAASDVVVHSSTRPEPFGRTVVEAMASGTPVVASGAGGVLEIVQHPETGLLVPPGNPTAMADAISRLLAEPAMAAAMGQAASKAVRGRFGSAASVRALESLYANVMASRDAA